MNRKVLVNELSLSKRRGIRSVIPARPVTSATRRGENLSESQKDSRQAGVTQETKINQGPHAELQKIRMIKPKSSGTHHKCLMDRSLRAPERCAAISSVTARLLRFTRNDNSYRWIWVKNNTNSRGGFTLLEIIVVIGIITLMAGIMIPMVYRVWESSEIDITKERMRDLKIAMVGDPKLMQNGVRTHFGFAGDIGQLPVAESLQDLVQRPAWVTNNWNGPYLPSGFDPNDYATDAWGNPIHYTPSSGTGELMELRSYGPDRSSGTADDDIVVKIYGNEIFPTDNVQGTINIIFNTAPSTFLNYSAKIYAKHRDGTGNLTNSPTTPNCYSPVSIPGDGNTKYFPIAFNVNLANNLPIGPVYFSATLFSDSACMNSIGGQNNPESLVNVNDRVSSVFANLQIQVP